MPYPSTFSTFNRPTPSDRLNSPSHSDLHNTTSSAVGQIEQYLGLSTSSAVGSLTYDIRSPQSDGGGHIQTAVKGGTGQTTYTKGDWLVASNSSTLSKLSVGADGRIPSANSSVATGIEWIQNPRPKISTSASVISVVTTAETSILSTTIPGSTLGTNNAVRATLFADSFTFVGSASVTFRAQYGNNQLASVTVTPTGNTTQSVSGKVEYVVIANNSENLQRGILNVTLQDQPHNPSAVTSVISLKLYNSNTGSVASSANQTMGVTAQIQNGSFKVDGSIVERIS